jgi:hypothetical protein
VSKYAIDTVLRVRLRHSTGTLEAVTAAIAEENAAIGDVVTVK